MNDEVISRQAAIEKLKELDWQDLYLPIHFKEFVLDELPSIQPKRGRWVYGTHFGKQDVYAWTCSLCNESYPWQPKYCPNCGAKMEKE